MVDVRYVSPVLTCGTHFLSISGNQHQYLVASLQALTKDISTPADIARSALETNFLFYCFMGYISALTYYLLLGYYYDLHKDPTTWLRLRATKSDR